MAESHRWPAPCPFPKARDNLRITFASWTPFHRERAGERCRPEPNGGRMVGTWIGTPSTGAPTRRRAATRRIPHRACARAVPRPRVRVPSPEIPCAEFHVEFGDLPTRFVELPGQAFPFPSDIDDFRERQHDGGIVQNDLHRAGRTSRPPSRIPSSLARRMIASAWSLRRRRFSSPAPFSHSPICAFAGTFISARTARTSLIRRMTQSISASAERSTRSSESSGHADSMSMASRLPVLLPQLLGHEGHERMEQLQDTVQGPPRHDARLRLRFCGPVLQLGLDEFEIPVAKGSPRSAIGGAPPASLKRYASILLGNSSAEAADFTDYPFVDGQAACRGVEPVHVTVIRSSRRSAPHSRVWWRNYGNPQMRLRDSLTSRPCAAMAARVEAQGIGARTIRYRQGSMMFPLLFDIFWPFSSRTSAWM